jgi:hypothetical protein
MTPLASVKHHLTRRRLHPPLGFVHIPKAGGTGMVGQIDTLLRPRRLVYGLDRSQFGSFTDFEGMPPAMRSGIILDRADLPPEIDCLVGHVAPSTILTYAPDSRLMTCLRIPQTRLLSHYTYWRSYDDAQLATFGGWGKMIATSQRDLASFLSEPAIACQTDNLITRMLLWPRADIPADNFIDPSHDEIILGAAHAMIDRFAHIDVMENAGFDNNLEAWLNATYGLSIWERLRRAMTRAQPSRTNQARKPFVRPDTPLATQLEGPAGSLLATRSRLDVILWSRVAQTVMPRLDHNGLITADLDRAITRYDRLSGFDQV